nr:hypothetical protein MFMH1_81140 [Myxococcus sp. MH1]
MFHDRARYQSTKGYQLAPLRFSRLDDARYVVTNDVGEYVVLPRHELVDFVRHALPPHREAYKTLKSKHFLFDEHSRVALELLALKYRTRAEQLANFTGLHIFVVTLRCDHSCAYCQVSRQAEGAREFDMSQEHADRALDFMFRSPSPTLKVEFQGGEPLLHFERIRYIVERAKALNQVHRRDL